MEYAALMLEALASPYGRKVTTSDPEKLRQRLYKERKTRPEFDVLSFVISPENPKGEIWIVRRDRDAES